MKTLFTLFIGCITFGLSAQVSVDEKSVNVEGAKNGFYISIPYGNYKQIENALNMYRVKGELDHDIAYIMNQQGFVPVQRLIRLVLARQNRKELKRFAFEYVSESSIRTLYEYAMSNDYMQDPQYAESLTMLGSIIEQKGMKNSGRIRRLARETEARLETSRVNV